MVRRSAGHAVARVSRCLVAALLMAVMVPVGVPHAVADVSTADTYWVDMADGNDAYAGTEGAPFKTITHAAAIADGLDTIMVEQGMYTTASGEVWPIIFNGESVVSVDGNTNTVISGAATGEVFVFNGWAGADRLEGFTITNGGLAGVVPAVQVSINTGPSFTSAAAVMDCAFQNNPGGGLGTTVNPGTNLAIAGNTFSGNARPYGGAINATAYGMLTVYDNEIFANTATYGAGMRIYSGVGASVLVQDNILQNNVASNSGGAIQWDGGSAAEMHSLSDNTIRTNTALIGAGLYLNGVNLAFTGNLGNANSAGAGQAGFAYLENADVLAESNYLNQNTSVNLGSVWTVDANSTLTEINDTVIDNGGSSYTTYAEAAGVLAVVNSIYWNPIVPVEMSHADNLAYSCSSDDLATLTGAGSTVGAGMVYSDPQIDYPSDPEFLPASPCLDAGSAYDYAAFDFFGTLIPQDGDGDRVARADIGCYEAPGVPLPTLVPIYRFYNVTNGTHFFTNSAAERDHVNATWPTVFRDEGVAYYLNPANNTTPLTRLYNKVSKSHFYTASSGEAAHALATWPAVFSLDGPTYAVNPGRVPWSTPVYRFLNLRNGSHFYTASETEKNTVIARWPDVYRLEGPAFWIGQ